MAMLGALCCTKCRWSLPALKGYQLLESEEVEEFVRTDHFQVAVMGARESKQVETPVRPLHNKHLANLANVADPRSPTTGILRTPIEVVGTPRSDLLADEEEEEVVAAPEAEEQPQSSDPRSPTPGIERTPLKTTMSERLNFLVKQLSEVFVREGADQESLIDALPREEDVLTMIGSPIQPEELSTQEPREKLSTEMGASEDSTAHQETVEKTGTAEKGAESSESPVVTEVYPSASQPLAENEESAAANVTTVPAIHAKGEEKVARAVHLTDSLILGSPRSSGSRSGKQKARKQSTKLLMMSSGSGRSPLKTLQEDNSPSTLTHRQVRKSFGVAENSSEQQDLGAGRSLMKPGRYRENVFDKENEHYPLMEN